MDRKPTPFGPRLEALLDERDHLQIQISLAADGQGANSDELDAMHKRLFQVEDEIARNWGSLRPT
jgi:hypothetical protein